MVEPPIESDSDSDGEEELSGHVAEQPPWIPDWVWSAYSVGCYSLHGATDIVRSKDCGAVWMALERRLGKPSPPYAARLFWAVNRALNFNGAAAMGSAERKKRAVTITKAVKTLNTGLAEAQLPLPNGIAFAQSVSTTEAIEEAGFIGSLHLGVVGNGIDPVSFEIGARVAAEFLVSDHLPMLLNAIAKDAANWANEAIVLRPNKPTAGRTYFIRMLTEFFVVSYGVPLRTSTLVLTSVFFDCQNMTTAEIASVAPAPDDL